VLFELQFDQPAFLIELEFGHVLVVDPMRGDLMTCPSTASTWARKV